MLGSGRYPFFSGSDFGRSPILEVRTRSGGSRLHLESRTAVEIGAEQLGIWSDSEPLSALFRAKSRVVRLGAG